MSVVALLLLAASVACWATTPYNLTSLQYDLDAYSRAERNIRLVRCAQHSDGDACYTPSPLAHAPFVRQLPAVVGWEAVRLPPPQAPQHYSRTYVYYTPHVEALLLAWSAAPEGGASSPMHDGGGCVMTVLRGALREVLYEERSGAPPWRVKERLLLPGQLVSMLPTCIQRLENAATTDTVSLHVCAPAM